MLKINDVHKVYQQGETRIEVLAGLNLDVAKGEVVAILGQSGSGKSTLLSLLAGLDAPTSGSINVAGTDLSKLSENTLSQFRARHLGIIFQQFHLLSTLTALENVSLPLEIFRNPRAAALAREVLDRVQLGHRAQHFPSTLSGGEKQRVAIARAFVVQPDLLLADEPSGNLDAETGEQVMSLLFDLTKQKQTTTILVTHNMDLAKRCDRILALREGRLHPF